MKPRHLPVALLMASLAGASLAQYKVVAPDGAVTYTDRPPVSDTAKISTLGRAAAATPAPSSTSLPFELRQVAARYPVTLYAATVCTPCDSGRQLLQQRGIPYSERRIVTGDDSSALERLSGGRTVPTLTIGAQALRGFNPDDWGQYLDAAGYPRESRLPPGWQAPAATALVSRVAATASAPATTALPSLPRAAANGELPASSPAFRF